MSVTNFVAVLAVAVTAVGLAACGSSHPAGTGASTSISSTSTAPLPDPFAGRAVPSSGFILLDNPTDGTASTPSSWSISLLDDAATRLGSLPRAVIGNDVLNSPLTGLVVTSTGVRIEHHALPVRDDDPRGCTTTGTNARLRIALCGTRSGDQLLGERIEVRHGSTWSTLAGKPPAPTGDDVVGHWMWATPAPDGRWVLAGWSGECEVQTALLVSVVDGSVRAITGERGVAWRSAPESGSLGWTGDGFALGVFGGSSDCGTAATVPRGVYRVAPTDTARRMLVPLSATQGVLRWLSADDRRSH